MSEYETILQILIRANSSKKVKKASEMSETLKEAFSIERKEFISFLVYEKYKHYIESELRPKEKSEWEMLQENITYDRDDLSTF